MKTTTSVLTTLTLALVAAAPAAAGPITDLPEPGDARYAVPAGKVEHTVTMTRVTGSKAVPSHTRHELWLSRNRVRSVVTDATTGKVTAETVVDGRETRTFDAETRTVTVRVSKRTSIPFNSFRFEAAVQEAYLERGITKVIGETTVRGRRALVVENVPGTWVSDQPESRTVAVVDAETHELYERTSTLPGGVFAQTEKHRTQVLGAGSAHVRFAMGKHPGAKVRRVPR